jgi:membrane-bound lytic murein transglycosylase B
MAPKMLAAGLLLLLTAPLSGPAGADANYAGRPELRQFIEEMVGKHGFDPAELEGVLHQARAQPSIIAAMTSPAEARPWHLYRPIFVNAPRVEGGVEFWNRHRELLARAQEVYGVDPAVIVAIIGVETRYGRNTGSHRVLDALATLAFDYPPRATFFRSELEHYLLLTREEGLDPHAIKGSYAGAMGKPQFISSSYRAYAVDFDGDGRRDLWNNTADVIGSVANYLRRHGWRSGQVVAVPARTEGAGHRELLGRGMKPHVTLGELANHGVHVAPELAAEQPAALLELQGEEGLEHWVTFDNFYVITRYNRSPLYAMAVHQLSQEILLAHNNQVAER